MPDTQHEQWIQSAVLQYEAPLVLYAARIVGDIDRARDVVQETFLRLCRQERSEVAPRLLEWLFAVCRNGALDVRRRHRVQSSLAAPTVIRPIAPPLKQAEDRELATRIINMLQTLPENQRMVISLKFQRGLSYKEISGETGLSISNVGFLIHTGLKTLRSAFEVRQ